MTQTQQGRRPARTWRPRRSTLTPRSLWAFFALSFGFGWGLAALPLAFPRQTSAVFGPVSGTHPLFVLAVYSPGIAGVLLVWRHEGWRGLTAFVRRFALWRMSAGWWLLLLLGIPAVKCLGAALGGTLAEPFGFSPWYSVLPALLLALAIGPVEELGWRGLALPLLQRKLAPLGASLVLGAVWGLWHLPAFLLSGTPQSRWSFGPYVLGVLALSVLVTPMFNAARGSLLVPVLFHLQMNNPAWPDAQPWENYLFAAIAVLVVVADRQSMLRRGAGVTDVLGPSRP